MNLNENKIETIGSIITSKWGAPAPSIAGRKGFNKPKYARFRMKVQYENGSAYYYSYDYVPKIIKGVIVSKLHSESIAIDKLLEMICKKQSYRYANLYCNITNDLDTSTASYDLLLCTIVNGNVRWKNVPIFRADNPQNLDIRQMLQIQTLSNEKSSA